MGCATGVVKFIMFLFNFIFVVGGILMVTAGALVLSNFKDYKDIVDLDKYQTQAPPILLIVVGAAVFFIAFMGCCGVLRESNCMMMTYAIFLTIILLVQIGIAVGAAVYEDEFKDILTKGFTESMKKYDSQKQAKETWDATQINLKCCGASTYMDWKPIRGEVPDSCCIKREVNCANGVVNKSEEEAKQTIYTKGCVDKVFSDLKIQYVVIAAAVVAAIELLGIMFSCCLAARFRRKNYA